MRPRMLESGSFSKSPVLHLAAFGFVPLRVSAWHPRVRGPAGGLIRLLLPDGTVYRSFSRGSMSAWSLAGEMLQLGRLWGGFVGTIDRPALPASKRDALLARMDDNRWKVREAATREAIALGLPAYNAFAALDLGKLSPEVRYRVRQILRTLAPLARSVIKKVKPKRRRKTGC